MVEKKYISRILDRPRWPKRGKSRQTKKIQPMKLRFLFFSIMAFGILSCDKSDQNPVLQPIAQSSSGVDWNDLEESFPTEAEWEAYQDSLAASTTFTSVSIPEPYQSSATSGDAVIFGIQVLNDEDEIVEGLIKFVINEDDDEKLVSLEISDSIFDQTSLTPNVWVDFRTANPSIQAGTHGDCLKGCEGVTRPKLCKAGCWAELGIRVGIGIATIVKVFQE